MATSQNGGLVLDYGDPRLITTVIPGTDGAKLVGGINGLDLNCIMMYIGSRWNREIEPIRVGWNWGHNVRYVRGQTTDMSNHSEGGAADFNAPLHPLGTRTLTAKQLDTLRSIANALDGVIRFGAFYNGRPDEMHAERIKSYAEVSRVANRIRAGLLPNTPDELLSRTPTTPPAPKPSVPAPAPSPAAPQAPAYSGRLIRWKDRDGKVISPALRGDDVWQAQARLNEHMRVVGQPGTGVDGIWGRDSDRVLRLYQWARHGAPFHLVVDGIIGPATWASLWK